MLGGCAGVEQAAKNGGHTVTVPFTPGRTDASQEQTDVESFAVLEPVADGFRNFQKASFQVSAEELLVDKAQLLTLTAPEMTVLVGGMRVLNTNVDGRSTVSSPKRPETLTNDFFVNLLDMRTAWKATSEPAICSKAATPRPGASNGPARASTSSSVRTLSSAPWLKSTEPGRAGEIRPRLCRGLEQGYES